jgi:hypothetical protein
MEHFDENCVDCGEGEGSAWKAYKKSFAELQTALKNEGYSDVNEVHKRIKALDAKRLPCDNEEREDLENLCIEYDRWRRAYDSMLNAMEQYELVDGKNCVDVGKLQSAIRNAKKDPSPNVFLEQLLEAYERLRPQEEPPTTETVAFTGFHDAGFQSVDQVRDELICIQDEMSRTKAKKPRERLIKKKEKLEQLLEDYSRHHVIGLDGITPIVRDSKSDEDIAHTADVELPVLDQTVEAAELNFASTKDTWPQCAERSLVLLYEHFRCLYGKAARPPHPETGGIGLLSPSEVLEMCKHVQEELRTEGLDGVTAKESYSRMHRAIVKLHGAKLKTACGELLEHVESCCGKCEEYGSSISGDGLYKELKALRKLCTDAVHNPKGVGEVCCDWLSGFKVIYNISLHNSPWSMLI